MFLTDREKQKLVEHGYQRETSDGNDHIDTHTLGQVLERHRQKKQKEEHEKLCNEKIQEAKEKGDTRLVSMAKAEVMQDLRRRSQRIKNEGWKRVLACTARLCGNGQNWDELGHLAGLTEEGITWQIGSEFTSRGIPNLCGLC